MQLWVALPQRLEDSAPKFEHYDAGSAALSSSKDRLEQAANDWRHQRFPRIAGETAYIPLPQDGQAPVNYP